MKMAAEAYSRICAMEMALGAKLKLRGEIGFGSEFRGVLSRHQLTWKDADTNIETMFENTIDLHTHTTYSDGSDTPSELVRRGAGLGAKAIAITDHDTVGGLAEGRAAADAEGIEFVTGVEISAEYGPGTMHILGYCVDDSSAELRETLAELQQSRAHRNPLITERLQALGVEIRYEEVVAVAGEETVGRPHFARVLLEKGYVASIQEAFDKFLAKGASAYVEKQRLDPSDTIRLIHRAGGAAVLAHPYQLRRPMMEEEDVLTRLAESGLDGIEAIYSRHTESQRRRYAEIAGRLGLVVTGGSDYHGDYKPDIDLVVGLGDLRVPYSMLERLRDRVRTRAGAGGHGLQVNLK
jgi:predicted metal-dependent phosphoesterase TrpH